MKRLKDKHAFYIFFLNMMSIYVNYLFIVSKNVGSFEGQNIKSHKISVIGLLRNKP